MTLRHLAAEHPLCHLPFPATTRELVRAAQRNGASDTLVTALLGMEQARFDSEADLRRALAHARRSAS